jgi:hypothetical protein
MPATEVVLFRESDGSVPLMEWLDKLPSKAQRKCTKYIDWLEDLGCEMRRPHADYLRDGVYELRPSFAGQQFRILYSSTALVRSCYRTVCGRKESSLRRDRACDHSPNEICQRSGAPHVFQAEGVDNASQ